MDDNNLDKWIGLNEAADYIGIKPVTLRKWLKEKKGVPAHKVGRLWKFKCSELDEWINSGDAEG